MRGLLSLLGLALVAVACSTATAFADTACVAGNFSSIAGTTCDIGSLQFTFSSISGGNSLLDTSTNSYTYYATWGNSDFDFIPVSDGFALSFLGGPQSTTAGPGHVARDFAELPFSVVDLDLGMWIKGPRLSGGVLSVSCNPIPASQAYGLYRVWGPGWTGMWAATQSVSQQDCRFETYSYENPPTAHTRSDHEIATPFYLSAQNGGAAWDGTPTAFTFRRSPAPTPEPPSALLLSTALVSMAGVVWRKLRLHR